MFWNMFFAIIPHPNILYTEYLQKHRIGKTQTVQYSVRDKTNMCWKNNNLTFLTFLIYLLVL